MWHLYGTNRTFPVSSENSEMLKGYFTLNWKTQSLFTHLYQTCESLFILLNTKDDILKNVGCQIVDGSHSLPRSNILENK